MQESKLVLLILIIVNFYLNERLPKILIIVIIEIFFTVNNRFFIENKKKINLKRS